MRELTARAHNVNLELGAALLKQLAVVDADDMNVARFFAYGLLGPDAPALAYLDREERTARRVAANGLRLVLDEHRQTVTPTLKSGGPGKTKVTYGEPDDAEAWLWRFVAGAKTAGELYGRAMVVFAAQHYAHQLVLPASQRRHSTLPCSYKDTARKAFERATKPLLPGSYKELARALERQGRQHQRRLTRLADPERELATPAALAEEPAAAGEISVDEDQESTDELAEAT